MKKTIRYLILILFSFFLPLAVSAEDNKEITLYFFHGDGCPHCAEEEAFLKTIENQYPNLKIEKYEVWYNKENAELLKKIETTFEIKRSGVPTNVIGDTIIIGYSSTIGRQIERAIKFYEENDYEDVVLQIKQGTYVKEEKETPSFEEEEKELEEEVSIDVPFFGKMNLKNFSLTAASALIGLIDGFNPCAMWVLLFLISTLIGMKDRKRMWIIGITFLLTSALFYMIIMLSWIHIIVKFTTIIWIRNIIAIIAIIGAFINLKSFIKSDESGCDVVDEKRRKKIFSKIRKFTSEKSIWIALIGVIGLAISINLVELACSAGLPLVFSELMAINNTTETMKIMYTLIYIFFFLIDDLIVFSIAMITMKLTGISTKYNKYSHLIGGLIMLVIGVLLILKPGWLMFNFK